MSHKRYYAKAGLLWLANLWRAKKKTFVFDGETYPYFYHPYNFTWLNERCVEIPIARKIMREYQGKRILEVGNVLSRYDETLTHTVIDKYERVNRPNFFAEDAETFHQGGPYDLIISISTLEHVGWDESPRDPDKIAHVVRHLRSLLSPNGVFYFTSPVGYSPPLDQAIDKSDGFTSVTCLRRKNVLNEWEQIDWRAAKSNRFHAPFPFANALVIARLGRT